MCSLDAIRRIGTEHLFRSVKFRPFPLTPPPFRRPTDRHGRDSHPRYLGRRVTGSDSRVGCGPGSTKGIGCWNLPFRVRPPSGALPSAHPARRAARRSPLARRRGGPRRVSPRRAVMSARSRAPRRRRRAMRLAGEALRVENAELRRRATALESALQNRHHT